MSLSKPVHFYVELNDSVMPRVIAERMKQGDSLAHVIVVHVTRDGIPARLDGMSVAARFVRSDGITVLCPGKLIGNVARVPLLKGCYAVAGEYDLSVRLTVAGTEAQREIVAGHGTITREADGPVLDPEHTVTVPSEEEIAAAMVSLQAVTFPATSSGSFNSVNISPRSGYVPLLAYVVGCCEGAMQFSMSYNGSTYILWGTNNTVYNGTTGTAYIAWLPAA